MAELLGYASVGRMLDELQSDEISEWNAYFKLKEQREKEHEREENAKQRAKRR